MQFACTTCSAKYEVSGQLAGTVHYCRACGEIHRLPSLSAQKQVPCPACKGSVAIHPTDTAVRCPGCGAKLNIKPKPKPAPPPEPPAVSPNSPLPPKSTRARWLALGSLMAVVLLVAAGMSTFNKKSDPPPVASSAPDTPKESFEKLMGQVLVRLRQLKPQRAQPFTHSEIGLKDSFQTTGELVFEYNDLEQQSYDVTQTNSLVSPYKGVLRFGVKVKGALNARAQVGQMDMPLAYTVDASYRCEGSYQYRDSLWTLAEATLTVTDIYYSTDYKPGDLSNKNIYSAGVVLELNKNKRKQIGSVAKLGADSELDIVKVMRSPFVTE
jgi:DNA-directed RNA polymerase subunit RPC12/RpoP